MFYPGFPDDLVSLGLSKKSCVIREQRREQHVDSNRLEIVDVHLVEENAVPGNSYHFPDKPFSLIDRYEMKYVDRRHPVERVVSEQGQIHYIAYLKLDLVLETCVCISPFP